MRYFDLQTIHHLAVGFDPAPLDDDFLNTRYDWQKTVNGVEWPYYRFFYLLSYILKPALVVELGGYQGTAAAHFAAGNPLGDVITIDHHTDPGDEINRVKMLEACANYSNLIYLQGWSNPEVAAREYGRHALGTVGSVFQDILSQTLHRGRKIDILFIDSWHTYENAMLDWETYRPYLANGALVICDDIKAGEIPGDPISGMLRFWDEMPGPKFLNANLHPGADDLCMGFVKYE